MAKTVNTFADREMERIVAAVRRLERDFQLGGPRRDRRRTHYPPGGNAGGFWAVITGKTTVIDGDGYTRGRYTCSKVEWIRDAPGTWQFSDSLQDLTDCYEVNRSNANMHLAYQMIPTRGNIVWLRGVQTVGEDEADTSDSAGSESASDSDEPSDLGTPTTIYLFDKGLTNTPSELREEM